MNKLKVGKDGKTAYERCKDKECTTLGLEFGEATQWKRHPTTGRLAKLMGIWADGVYLGVKGTSGEIIVGTKKGI